MLKQAGLLLLCICFVPSEAVFDRLVVLGDSLSDDGGDHGVQSIVRQATHTDVVSRLSLGLAALRVGR